MIIAIGFLLLFVINPCYSQSGSGVIKICVVGNGNNSDESWGNTIDSIVLYIARNHSKAPQVFVHESGDLCEYVGNVDRAKKRSDFILIAKKHNSTKFNCDPEWGRQSFAVLNFYPENYKPIDRPNQKARFHAKIAFVSSETGSPNWTNVTSAKRLLTFLSPRFMSHVSEIPDDYPFKAEREERTKRRTLKAVIALMALAVCSLLVIMFLGSLSRYNEAKQRREAEMEKQKRHEQQSPPSAPSPKFAASPGKNVLEQPVKPATPSKNVLEPSVKTATPNKNVLEPSIKTATPRKNVLEQSVKTANSKKMEKTSEGEMLIEISEKSEKSAESSRKKK